VAFESGGRDPLGLSRLSDFLKAQLLTGIVTNNNRARYYSYFCWSLWHIEAEETAKKYKDFVDRFRRREAVLALATLANNPKAQLLIGIEATAPKLAKGRERKEVDCDFQILPSNRLGAFGQYFRGSLYELGLSQRSEDGVYHVAPGEGEKLAQTFHALAAKTPYVRKRLFAESRLPLGDLTKSQQYLALDSIKEPFAAAEREQLIEAFFKFESRNPSQYDLSRRHTLALILHVVSEYERNGFRPRHPDNHIMYPAYYYDVLWLTDRKVAPYKCPDVLKSVHSIWKQYCLHQFFTQAMEDLLHSVLGAVGSESTGLRPEELAGKLVGREFLSTLKILAGRTCKRPRDLFNAIGVTAVPDETLSSKLRKEIGYLHDQSEVNLGSGFDERTPQTSAAIAFVTLAVLYGKWRGAKSDAGFSHVSRQAGAAYWVRIIFPYFDSWVQKDVSWEDVMRSVVEMFVLSQHYQIMRERRKPESVWVHINEGRITKEQDYLPTLRTSRHFNAVSIMRDLLLLKADEGDGLSVTPKGRQVLKKALS
jgi:hypothetical protein